MGFRKDFAWGAATSSYQIEGAVKGEGKGEHIWDVYVREPGHVFEGHTGETACDHYHRYREDVRLMNEMGLKAPLRDTFEMAHNAMKAHGRAVQMLRQYGKQYFLS